MKIGISTYSLAREAIAGRMDAPAMIDFVADHNGEQIEISPGSWCKTSDDEIVKAIVKRAEERNILISSYTVGANFIKPASGSPADEVARMKKEVEIGAKLGVPLMRCDAASRPPEECTFEQFEKDLLPVAECVGEVADHAAKYGITLTVENHGFLFQNSERVQKLIKTVNRKNYRTTLDVGNFLCDDEDPVHATVNNLPFAAQIHFKDFLRIAPGAFQPAGNFIKTRCGYLLRGTIIGHGILPVEALAKVIKESGFDGCISVEFEGPEECLTATAMGMETLQKLFK